MLRLEVEEGRVRETKGDKRSATEELGRWEAGTLENDNGTPLCGSTIGNRVFRGPCS